MGNGGPAPSDFTERIFALSKEICEYMICPCVKPNISGTPGTIYNYLIGDEERRFTVIVADSIQDYIDMMKGIFNFEEIKEYLKSQRILVNSLHGVTGPYAERIFGDELGAPKPSSFMKTNILEDFGGGHPDPNLTYAKDLVDAMEAGDYGFGAAFDGDGDRNMILGAKAFFVTPCDSLAVIANNLEDIPYFQKEKVVGYARSMPTSLALDRVAAARGKKCFETPTGWKFFGNLLDAGEIALCGEESFGTGSNHIREKDGIWAALAWLQILAKKKMTVEEVLKDHWNQFGRNFFTRYDYEGQWSIHCTELITNVCVEGCESAPCETMMTNLQSFVDDKANIGREYSVAGATYTVSAADNFSYTDPIDGSVASKQGIRIMFSDGSRLVFRLSGTGSSGATVRMYVDSFCGDQSQVSRSAGEMLAPVVQLGLEISQLRELTGRQEPTVVT